MISFLIKGLSTLLQNLSLKGFPYNSVSKEPAYKQETQVQVLGQEDPMEKEIATTAVFLPGESHGQMSLAVYSI